jgi:hypothetical protein
MPATEACRAIASATTAAPPCSAIRVALVSDEKKKEQAVVNWREGWGECACLMEDREEHVADNETVSETKAAIDLSPPLWLPSSRHTLATIVTPSCWSVRAGGCAVMASKTMPMLDTIDALTRGREGQRKTPSL